MGRFEELTPARMAELAATRASAAVPAALKPEKARYDSALIRLLTDRVVNSPFAVFKGHAPVVAPAYPPLRAAHEPIPTRVNAKYILDTQGPEGLRHWLLERRNVLVTDTTMRDAHQSLLATRVRTADMLAAADETSRVLHDAFSLEVRPSLPPSVPSSRGNRLALRMLTLDHRERERGSLTFQSLHRHGVRTRCCGQSVLSDGLDCGARGVC